MASSDLTWTQADSPVNQIDEYRVFKSVNVLPSAAGFADSFVLLTTLPVVFDPEPPFGQVHPLTFSDTAVDFSTNFYCYRVDAVSVLVGEATGGSPQTGVGPSNIFCIGTPSSPATLTGDKINDNQLDLSWVNGAVGILPAFSTCIFRSVNGGPFTLLAEVFEPTVTFSDTTVDNSINTYDYFVTTKDVVDIESDPSNTVTFGLNDPIMVNVNNSGFANRHNFSPDGSLWFDGSNVVGNWVGCAFDPVGNVFVTVESSGGTSAAMRSTDGKTWVEQTTPLGTTHNWTAVAWSPSLSLFCACASGNDTMNIMTSPDGIVWTLRDPGPGATMRGQDIIWIDDFGGRFVVIGTSTFGGNNDAQFSADGITWTFVAINFVSTAQSIAYNPTAQRLVVTADSNTFTSDDGGSSWADRGAHGLGSDGVGMGYSTTAGLFFVFSSLGFIFTSPDGLTWTVRTGDLGTGRGAYYAPTLDLMVALENGDLYTSTDGITWTQQTTSDTGFTDGVEGLTPGTGKQEMVMVEDNAASPVAGLSQDGAFWVTNATAFPFRLDDVAWSSPLGLYAAVGDGVCVTSPDGIVWTSRTVPSNDWQVVYWDDSNALFIAGALDGFADDNLMTSVDGITWIQRSSPADLAIFSITSDGAGRIVAAGNTNFNPVGNNIFSDDGINWSQGTDPAQLINAMVYDTARSRFVQVENTGRVNVSSDGATWTLDINSGDIGSGGQGNTSGMDYSPTLDQLVWVGNQGIYSSEDGGASWTQRNANDMQDVRWSPVTNKWIACNNAAPLLFTSVDGITWIAGVVAAETWVSIALGDQI